MSTDSIITQSSNPAHPTPPEIEANLRVISVMHYDFDDTLVQGTIIVHHAIADDVRAFFALAQELSFPIARVIPISTDPYLWDDERSCEANNSSGFNFRHIMGTNRLSKHATGNAFDINPYQNIYVRYDETGNEIYRCPAQGQYIKNAKGTLTENHPLVLLMKKRGFIWGGDWTRERGCVDYQHFEKE